MRTDKHPMPAKNMCNEKREWLNGCHSDTIKREDERELDLGDDASGNENSVRSDPF